MKLDITFFRSKVARRIFLLFISCALVPITALSVVSFRHVSVHLHEEAWSRLHQTSKTAGMAIYERMLFVQANMTALASQLNASPAPLREIPSHVLQSEFTERFRNLALTTDGGVPFFGDIETRLEFSADQRQHMSSGKSAVSLAYRAGAPTRLYMYRALDPEHLERGILLGEVDPTYVWDLGNLPPRTELSLVDQSGHIFVSSLPLASFPEGVSLAATRSGPEHFEWASDGEEYLAGYWTIPLKYAFLAPAWTVVVSEAKGDVLAPMKNFTQTFLLVILISLWVVVFLSIIQIRRSMIPLEQLQEGTRRIAGRDFERRVEVRSRDEFQDLAASFNAMAKRLDRQFTTLATISEIDRAVLAALDTSTILDTVLIRLPEVFPCDHVSMTLLDPGKSDRGRTYVIGADAKSAKRMADVSISPEELRELREQREGLVLVDRSLPGYLVPLAEYGLGSWLVLPILVKGELLGIVTLGHFSRPSHDEEDLAAARQLVNQVAVALSNARLIEQLDELNWGTLTALSRAIDAKSSWTLGHSERAAKMALKIARVMGLPQKELDNLHRGALLHDIGKIAIPPAILDKPGKLTPEEMRIMRNHPREGARILEPIAPFADSIPVVLQHHEWFDGSGYPDGAAGEEIKLIARIYAVADVFDALVSDRPYRDGLARDVTIEYIKERASRQFDPNVVQAFLKLMTREEQESGIPQDRTEDTTEEAPDIGRCLVDTP